MPAAISTAKQVDASRGEGGAARLAMQVRDDHRHPSTLWRSGPLTGQTTRLTGVGGAIASGVDQEVGREVLILCDSQADSPGATLGSH